MIILEMMYGIEQTKAKLEQRDVLGGFAKTTQAQIFG